MILTTAVLLVLWGVTVVRVPTLWRDQRQRMLWAAILMLALARTTAYQPVDDRLGVPLLPHVFGVLAAYFLLRVVALATGRGGARWQPALAVAVLVALAVLAAVAGGIDTRPERIARHLGAAHVAYWVILEAYLGAVLITASILFASVARQAPPRLPRLGLWAMAAGTALVALYATAKTALIVAHGAGMPVDFTRFEPVARVFQGTGLLLVLLGLLVPVTRRIRSAVRAYRSLLVLRPLWTAMRDAFPEVILFSPRRAVIELAGVDDVHLRLYRRVIEIRDGMLALRGFLPPDYTPTTQTSFPYAQKSPAPTQTSFPYALSTAPTHTFGEEGELKGASADAYGTRGAAGAEASAHGVGRDAKAADANAAGRERGVPGADADGYGRGRKAADADAHGQEPGVKEADADAHKQAPGVKGAGAGAYGQRSRRKRARAGAYGQAMLEAQAIVLALRRREAGKMPGETPGIWAAVGPEMADEVAWLSLVSDAYRRISPGGVRTPTPFGSAR